MVLKHPQNPQHAVVHVAEAAGLVLLRVVQPPHPVHDHLVLPRAEQLGRQNRGAGDQRAVLEEALEGGQVLGDADAD